MYIARVSVESPGPPPVIAYGMSNVWIAVIVRKMSATKIAGRSIGRVTSTNCCHGDAPSTSAASYSDRGIVSRHARSIRARKRERQRPRQQQAEADRPLDAKGPVREKREAEPDHERARHGDQDVDHGLQERMPEAIVVEGAQVIGEPDTPFARR